MSELSDDYGAPVAPHLSTEAPSHSMRMEERSKGQEGVLEQQAKGVPEQQARGVPERWAEERPTVETAGPPPQDAGVDPKATAGTRVGSAGSEKSTENSSISTLVLELFGCHILILFWRLTS